jgi:hypothetical protein
MTPQRPSNDYPFIVCLIMALTFSFASGFEKQEEKRVGNSLLGQFHDQADNVEK